MEKVPIFVDLGLLVCEQLCTVLVHVSCSGVLVSEGEEIRIAVKSGYNGLAGQ